MRGRSQMLMSNSSRCFHTGSEHTLTSELDTVLHSVSLPWNSPACTTSWGRCRSRRQVAEAQPPAPPEVLPLPPEVLLLPPRLKAPETSSFHMGIPLPTQKKAAPKGTADGLSGTRGHGVKGRAPWAMHGLPTTLWDPRACLFPARGLSFPTGAWELQGPFSLRYPQAPPTAQSHMSPVSRQGFHAT